MRIFQTDQAMMDNPRLDTIGRLLLTAGQIMTQIGTKLVQGRNELLTAALEKQAEAIHAAYQAGRTDEREGVPDPDDILDEDQAAEDQADEDPDEFQEHARL